MPTKFDFQLIRDKFSNLNKKNCENFRGKLDTTRKKKSPRVHQEGVERSVLLGGRFFSPPGGKATIPGEDNLKFILLFMKFFSVLIFSETVPNSWISKWRVVPWGDV